MASIIILTPKVYLKRQKDSFVFKPWCKKFYSFFDYAIKPILIYGVEIWILFNILSQHVFVIIQLITMKNMKYIRRFCVKNLLLSNSNFADFIKRVKFAVRAELG